MGVPLLGESRAPLFQSPPVAYGWAFLVNAAMAKRKIIRRRTTGRTRRRPNTRSSPAAIGRSSSPTSSARNRSPRRSSTPSQSDRVAHAYLFTGARGVGKTSTARILAKALNCVKGPTPTPCDECESCQAIAVGEDVDVLEIDGASNRGIDEIRELRQNVQFRPSRSRYKIYIIDEVHMLTRTAFNALLKTLEEPPPHVKFIFATTEVQKIPITILSRCQRFDFAGIAAPRIVDSICKESSQRRVQADDEALRADRPPGRRLDARCQSLLDQLLAFGDERLTPSRSISLLGTAPDDRDRRPGVERLSADAKRRSSYSPDARPKGLAARRIARSADRLLARPDARRQLRLERAGHRTLRRSRDCNTLREQTLLDTISPGSMCCGHASPDIEVLELRQGACRDGAGSLGRLDRTRLDSAQLAECCTGAEATIVDRSQWPLPQRSPRREWPELEKKTD